MTFLAWATHLGYMEQLLCLSSRSHHRQLLQVPDPSHKLILLPAILFFLQRWLKQAIFSLYTTYEIFEMKVLHPTFFTDAGIDGPGCLRPLPNVPLCWHTKLWTGATEGVAISYSPCSCNQIFSVPALVALTLNLVQGWSPSPAAAATTQVPHHHPVPAPVMPTSPWPIPCSAMASKLFQAVTFINSTRHVQLIRLETVFLQGEIYSNK